MIHFKNKKKNLSYLHKFNNQINLNKLINNNNNYKSKNN